MCGISLTDYPERFESLRQVDIGGVAYELERVWYHKDQPIFQLRNVNTISDAEKLVGQEIRIPAEQRWKLPDGEYYFSDLVGCRMVDDATGTTLGTVTGWQELGDRNAKRTQVLLEVDDGAGGEPLLVPFASGLLKRLDLSAGEIRLAVPEGLIELNR